MWLHLESDEQQRLLLFSPIDITPPYLNWVGVELNNAKMAPRFDMVASNKVNYILLDPSRYIVAKNGVYLPKAYDYSDEYLPTDDLFFIKWGKYLPKYLVLSKQIGDTGWRLAYYVRFSDMFKQGDLPIFQTIGVVTLLSLVVLYSLWQIRRRFVMPALQQYYALHESERLIRSVVEVAPVGLCLLDRSDGHALFSNKLAEQWLQQEDTAWRQQMQYRQRVVVERTLADGRNVSVQALALTYHGQPVTLCALHDVTESKRVEHSLVAARNKADLANRAKSEFIATVSHEIRVPLFGITGTLELLGLTDLNSVQRSYVKTIQQSSETLLYTINETLDLSRAETDTIKFTVGGHIAVRLSAQQSVSPNEATLCFQVSDTGVGINAEAQASVLMPYFTESEGQTSLDSSGSGLGLFICNQIVKRMGGELSLVSAPGLGTSVKCVLTLAVGTRAPNKPSLHGTVYVAGAVQDIVLKLCEWLERWGLQAIPYQSGDRGLDKQLLLNTWPNYELPVDWEGPQLVLRPPGLLPNEASDKGIGYYSCYDYDGLYDGLVKLLQAQQR